MGLVFPVEEAAAQVACSKVVKSYFNSAIASVAAIPPLSHLIDLFIKSTDQNIERQSSPLPGLTSSTVH